MHYSDILISDVSSVFVEYLALDKPIILVNNENIERFPNYNKENIEYEVRDSAYQINTAQELIPVLENVLSNDSLKEKRKEYSRKLFAPLDGKNSYRIAKVIKKVIDKGRIGKKRKSARC